MLNQISNADFGDFSCEHGGDLSSNFFNLRVLGITGLSLLFGTSFGESNGENTENIAVVGFNVTNGFNESLPLSNHGTKLVSGDIHSVECGFSGGSFDVVDDKLNLSPSQII